MSQNVNTKQLQLQYTIFRDCPTSSGDQGDICLYEVQGETNRIESTQIRWFWDSQVVRLDHMRSSQRQLKGEPAIRLELTQIRWSSRWPGWEADLGDRWSKTPKTKLSSRGTTRMESTQIIWFS